jgi:transcriptional regulator with XRE-family HTH domain
VVKIKMQVARLPKQSWSRTPAVVLTPQQLRAARALLGWSREDLAEKSGVGAGTIKDFEINNSDPKQGTVQKWQRALEAGGVKFIDPDEMDGAGVRLRGAKKR